jgi:hypothetical protein
MPLKYLLTLAGILLAVWGGILLYNFFHSSDYALDRRLAYEAMQDVTENHEIFNDKVKSIEFVEPGHYAVEVEGVTDALEAGKLGYNCIAAVLNNNWKLHTTRDTFTLRGYQDGELIFEVFSTASATEPPVVKLYGPFEGMEYIPSFSRSVPERDETFDPSITSYA